MTDEEVEQKEMENEPGTPSGKTKRSLKYYEDVSVVEYDKKANKFINTKDKILPEAEINPQNNGFHIDEARPFGAIISESTWDETKRDTIGAYLIDMPNPAAFPEFYSSYIPQGTDISKLSPKDIIDFVPPEKEKEIVAQYRDHIGELADRKKKELLLKFRGKKEKKIAGLLLASLEYCNNMKANKQKDIAREVGCSEILVKKTRVKLQKLIS